jgi:predicted transcriptional regulator
MSLRSQRNTLGISQLRLARLSGVGKFKICTYELGDGSLTPEEQARIHAALINEAERLRNIAVEFGQTEPIAAPVGAG